MIEPAPYRGRFAPSPTGALHLGLARTALLGYLRARAQGGVFVLRSEDLDTPRVVPGAEQALLDDLRFLGIDWDEGPDIGGPYAPYVQSQRSARYAAAIEQLRAKGLVYACTCSRKEVALASAPHGPAEFGPVYPGTCRAGPSRPGAPAALRFRAPDVLPSFVDACAGRNVAPLAQGDFVLQRADGLFSYQLAVVVDDIAMRISEVLRGEDLAGCTGWQLALYDALEAPRPAFAHVPLLLDAQGRRLAKRDAATSIAQLRAQGRRADEIIGELAASLRLVPPGTRALPADLIDGFELARIGAP
jgi:glutamyl-tRNA synthetase